MTQRRDVLEGSGAIAFEPLEPRLLLSGDVILSELMASNDSVLADGYGEYPDWIELRNLSPEPVDLTGWKLVDSDAEWVFPSVELAGGGYLVVFASDRNGQDPSGRWHTNFKLSAGGEYLALVDDGGVVVHEYRQGFPEQLEDISYGILYGDSQSTALVSKGDAAAYWIPTGAPDAAWAEPGYPESGWSVGPTGLGFGLSSSGGAVTLIPAGSLWRYLDDGSDQGSSWRSAGFDDTSWASGWAELGYGDGDEATVVGYGPSASDKYITTYFRHTFSVTDAWSVTDLTVRVLRDDGAVMYLNGVELPRSNMPDGAIDYLTPASGNADETTFYEYALDGGLLAEGSNVLAVEVHQRSGGSSDISFDLELSAKTSTAELIETDVGAAMLGVGPSALVRVPFVANEPEELSRLVLEMAYEDGFAAYLNGVPVASRNAPPSPTWDSVSLGDREEIEATRFEAIDLTQWLPLVVEGDNVLAVHALNDGAGDGTFLICPKLTGYAGPGSVESYFTTPTPGRENVEGVLGMVADTKFSVDRGLYDSPQSVAITTSTAGAQIRYTLDGSAPTATTGTAYTGPIPVTTTTTLRAAAYKPGWLATDIDTHTYIFLDDVIAQPNNPPGYPSTWSGRPADYEMDPDVVGPGDVFGGLYRDTIADDLKSLPTLSVVMDAADLFGPSGIYVNPQSTGSAWERPTSVELISPDGTEEGFSVNCGIRVQGGASRSPDFPKHSFRLEFRSRYGPGRLRYPLFDDQPFGESAVNSFDEIVLRTSFNQSWPHWHYYQAPRAQYARDQWVRDLQFAMGQPSTHGRYVHLYLNGMYWGIYNMGERPAAPFQADYFGGTEDDYDVLNSGSPIDGDKQAWDAMMAIANGGLSGAGAYADLEEYLDVEGFIDYMILNHYVGNSDWDGHNWIAARRREQGAPYLFFTWDSEFAIALPPNNTLTGQAGEDAIINMNRTGLNNNNKPSRLLQKLRANSEFVMQFADRVHRWLFNDGVLTPAGATALWDARADEVDRAVVAESARWGDYRRDVHSNRWPAESFGLFTRNEHYIAQQRFIRERYLPVRTGVVLQQYRAMGLYPSVDAASFSVGGAYRHGGAFSRGELLTIDSGPGTVYYTLDGTDPREAYGAVSPEALIYTGPVALADGAHVMARLRSGGQWSALNEAEFVLDELPPVRVTEMMYNPANPTPEEWAAGIDDNDRFEFVELRNVGGETVNLLGVRFSDGIDYTFPYARLDPGGYVVLVEDVAAFDARYDIAGGAIPVVGQYGGSLSNGGERVVLSTLQGEVIQEFTYGDWHGQTDGEGFSLNVIDPWGGTADWSDPLGWHGSTVLHGTPGGGDTGLASGSVVINEVMAHTDGEWGDWIELHNTTDAPIDIGGWFLSDQKTDADGRNMLTKYRIAEGTEIGAGAYRVFTEVEHFGPGSDDPGRQTAFALSEHGDDVYLSSGSGTVVGGYREHVDFGASPNGVSFGLWFDGFGGSDFTLLSAASRGGPNGAPLVGDLILNEVMYHPADPTASEIAGGFTNDGSFEFIELHNRSAGPVDLREYRIDDGVGYTFGWYPTDGSSTAWWTQERGASASWTAGLPQSGDYEVLVYVDADDDEGGLLDLDSCAEYEVHRRDGVSTVVLNQNLLAGSWASLGSFPFDAGPAEVVLRRGADGPGERTMAAGVTFVAAGEPGVVAVGPTRASWSTSNASPMIPAGGCAVLVADYAGFDLRHDIAGNGIPVVGEYTGKLSNDGETVRVYRAAEAEATGYIPWIREDKLEYDDAAPWFAEADGQGSSLGRLDGEAYGNDPANWPPGVQGGTPGSANAFLDWTPPTIPADLSASAVAAGRIDLTWTASSDDGSGVAFYTVYRNGDALGTSPTTGYSDTTAASDTAYGYEVSATNADGFAGGLSAPVDITVVGIDRIVVPDSTTVRVVFTEPVTAATAEVAANYTIAGAAVSSATLEPDGVTVALTTSQLQQNQPQTLTVGHVASVSGHPLPTSLQREFVYAPTGSGSILREFWTGISGNSVTDLTAHANYPENPTGRGFPTSFEAPADWTDTYGTRLRGYVHPPTTGEYTFWIASDDGSELYLSSDEDPSGAALIASVSGWTSPREWTKYASQQSAAIHLEAGRRYYIEAVHKEGTGSDHVSVGWQVPGGAYERPIPGLRLSPLDLGNLPPLVAVDPLTTADSRPPLSGTVSDPTARIVLLVNGRGYLASNDGDGTWSLADDRISPALPDGTYDVRAEAMNGYGTGRDATDDELTVDANGPTVTQVRVASTSWGEPFRAAIGGAYAVPAGADQVNELPWANLDQLTVVFSEPVSVVQEDLRLYGVSIPEYLPAAFTYDADTLAATWTFPAGIGSEKLLLSVADAVTDAFGHALDGEWTDAVSSYCSGNGLPGGDFRFRLNVLPGDADQSGEVRSSDVIKVRRKSNTAPGDPDYSCYYDVDGSGEIRSSDVIKVRRLGNTQLPAGEPVVPPASAAASEPTSLALIAAALASADREAADDQPTSSALDALCLPEVLPLVV